MVPGGHRADWRGVRHFGDHFRQEAHSGEEEKNIDQMFTNGTTEMHDYQILFWLTKLKCYIWCYYIKLLKIQIYKWQAAQLELLGQISPRLKLCSVGLLFGKRKL